MEACFLRNIPALSEEEQKLLGQKHVLVLGCGGLGGTVIEHLVRLGVGEITAVDGDVLEESNLNRQLLSVRTELGKSKAIVAKERARAIRPEVRFSAVSEWFDEENAAALLENIDLVVDGLDNVSARLLMERFCGERGISIVHGAVQGWVGQVSVIPPRSGLLTRLYAGQNQNGDKSCLGFAAAFVASVQCAQAVKLLCGRKAELENQLFLADLEKMKLETIDFSGFI